VVGYDTKRKSPEETCSHSTVMASQAGRCRQRRTRRLRVIPRHLQMTGTKFRFAARGLCGACTCIPGASPFVRADVGQEAGRQERSPPSRAWAQPSAAGRLDREQVRNAATASPAPIMQAASLLSKNPIRTRQEIVRHMAANLCPLGMPMPHPEGHHRAPPTSAPSRGAEP